MSNAAGPRLVWLSVGVVLGASVVLLVSAYTGAVAFSYWVYSYQTLIAAILAIATAVWTVSGTFKAANLQISSAAADTRSQIQHSLDVERRSRAERLFTARARLSFSLSALVHYCKSTTSDLEGYLQANPLGGPAKLPIKFAVLDADLRDILASISEVAGLSPPEVARQFSYVLIALQICISRLREQLIQQDARLVTAVIPTEVSGLILDFCGLNARVTRLFPYARFKTEDITEGPIGEEELTSSALILGASIASDDAARLARRFSLFEAD